MANQEEDVIAVKLIRFVDQGSPLNHAHVADAVELLVEVFDKDCQDQMSFYENSPGPK